MASGYGNSSSATNADGNPGSAAAAQAAAAKGNAAASNAANGSSNTSSSGTSTTSSGLGLGFGGAYGAQGVFSAQANNSLGSLPGGNAYSGGWNGSGSTSSGNDYQSVISGLRAQDTSVYNKDNTIGYVANAFANAFDHEGLAKDDAAASTRLGVSRDNALRDALSVLENGGTPEEAAAAYNKSYRGGTDNISNAIFTFKTKGPNGRTYYISQSQIESDINAILGIQTGPSANANASPASATTNMFTQMNEAALANARGNNTPTAATTAATKSSPAASSPATPSIGSAVTDAVSSGIATGIDNASNATNNYSSGANSGITYRGGTVTDNGSGGSISSGITPPSRDSSSIGLGVYNPDKANYDQDNWNRGMEVQSSSLVSDEECKAFAKRAFSESTEPFKKVRVTIIKKM